MKANALLANAAMQRISIKNSSDLGFATCYPTYYGSSIIWSPSNNALSQMPLSSTKDVANGINTFTARFSDLAERFPNKNFIVIVADNSNTSLANPVLCTVSDAYTTTMANSSFSDSCSNLDNVSIIDVSLNNPQSYYQKYYRTDHHWNGWGAVSAYLQSLDATNHQKQLEAPLKNLTALSGFDWLVEHGSACRNGLMLVDEPVDEPALPLSEITLEQGTAPAALSNQGVDLMREAGPIACFDFYQTWYGQWIDTVAVNHSAVLPETSALVICDSFGTAFKWVASTGYGRVTTLYDLHDSRDNVEKLSNTLNKNDADTVFLVARVTSYQKVLDRFPEYLD